MHAYIVNAVEKSRQATKYISCKLPKTSLLLLYCKFKTIENYNVIINFHVMTFCFYKLLKAIFSKLKSNSCLAYV